ncbi:hypothetical protein ACC759_37750, partial [Rhizobium ruizarguesonis]
MVTVNTVVGVDDLAAHHGEFRRQERDLVLGAGEEVLVRDNQIGKMALLDASLLALLVGEKRDLFGPHPQRR